MMRILGGSASWSVKTEVNPSFGIHKESEALRIGRMIMALLNEEYEKMKTPEH